MATPPASHSAPTWSATQQGFMTSRPRAGDMTRAQLRTGRGHVGVLDGGCEEDAKAPSDRYRGK
jgi:hypothetical protein